MKKLALLVFLFSIGAVANLRADDQTASVQQELKDQGYYYGQIDGQPGPETSAAIRRYQIRNGLQVDGTLNKETLDSLKIVGGGTAPAATGQALPPQPAPLNQQAPPPPQPVTRKQDMSQGDREFLQQQPAVAAPEPPPAPPVATTPAPTPETTTATISTNPRVVSPPVQLEQPPAPQQPAAQSLPLTVQFVGIFAHTPYQNAPYEVQLATFRRAQAELARQTYYNGEVDGIPGPQTIHAIAAFQSDSSLPQTGRLDLPTLNALRLLPNVSQPPVQRRVIIQPFYPPPRYQPPRGGVWVD